LATAKVWLKDAIAKAPANADALGLLASCSFHEAYLGFAPLRALAIEEAEELARRAIALDQDSDYSHWVLGLALFDRGALDDAAAELRRALELNPNNSLAYGTLGALQCYLGLPEEGIANLERCVRANPWDPSIFFRFADLAHANFLLERYEKAVEWARKSLQRRPDWRFALLMLGTSLVQLGRVDEAQSAVREYLRLSPSGSLSKLQRHLPHRRPGDRERLVNALRAAGLPE
jgi:tetratricopeptide (TPR) repeat protein